jgi:hypothetical protein
MLFSASEKGENLALEVRFQTTLEPAKGAKHKRLRT